MQRGQQVIKGDDGGLACAGVAVGLGDHAIGHGDAVAPGDGIDLGALGLGTLQRGREAKLPVTVFELTPGAVNLRVKAKGNARAGGVQLAIGRQGQTAKVPLRASLYGGACCPVGQQCKVGGCACEVRCHSDANGIANVPWRTGPQLHLAHIQSGMGRGDAQIGQRQCQLLQRRPSAHGLHLQLPVAYAHKLGH